MRTSLESWNNHRDHAALAEIYETSVPKIAIDVIEVLNEYVGKTTGGKVSYTGDRDRCVNEGRMYKQPSE